MSVYAILEELAADNSRLAKEAILRREHGNHDLKEVVRLALDPLTQFYIRKIPVYGESVGAEDLRWGMGQLYFLSSRGKTGNAAIDHLKFILENVSETDALVIERIISKDLRCGVSVATANKTWPGLVSEFPCMLASGFEEKLVNKIKFPAVAQLKLDGMRAAVVVENGALTVYSRNGKIIDIGNHFADAFVGYGYDNVVFDGELLVRTPDDGYADRKTGNGILNKAVKGTISAKEVQSVVIVLFDMIPLQDFRKGICIAPYSQRFESLVTFAAQVKSPKVKIVPSREVASVEEARIMFDDYIAEGHEGIILKDLRSPWEDKRSKWQIKFKAELDCDLLCVDVEEGTGKNKGKLGALVLESADGVIKVNVGTGFRDADREEYWKNKPVGKVVAVCYNARISDKNTGVESLFLPRFLEVREDKTKADSSNVIK